MNFKIRIDPYILNDLGVLEGKLIDNIELANLMFKLDKYFDSEYFYDMISEAYYLYVEEAIFFAKLFDVEAECALLQYYLESYDEYMARNHLYSNKLNRRVFHLLEILLSKAEYSVIKTRNLKKVKYAK